MVDYVGYVLSVCLVIAVPFYIVFLQAIYKFRKQKPFDSSFFKICFSLGLLDFVHLFQSWVLNRFPSFGWFKLDEFVLLAPSQFAKFASMLWWFAALGQTLTVLLMAINRMAVVALNKEWPRSLEKVLLGASWIVPFVFTLPQLRLEFNYETINGSRGVLLYWRDTEAQFFYYHICMFWCSTLATSMASMYAFTYYKARQHRLDMERISRHLAHKRKVELKLACVGFVMFLLRCLCALSCGAMSLFSQGASFMVARQLDNILGDVNACINPVLLFCCSQATRRALWKLLTGSSENSNIMSLLSHPTTRQSHPNIQTQENLPLVERSSIYVHSAM